MVTKNFLNNNVASTILQDEHMNLMHKHVSVRKQRRITGILSMLIAGLTSLLVGLLATQYSLLELTLSERARMRPNLLPSYDIWRQPQPIVRLRVNVFTALNAGAFLAGTDSRIRLQELGPIVYREHLRHEDIVRHPENSTMSFTAVRWLEFLEAENEPGILNRTITVPNFALLSAGTMFADASFFLKVAFKALQLSTGDTAFINITVYDYLWNYHSKMVQQAATLVPFMVPVDNTGILTVVYTDLVDRYNVRIGDQYTGRDFFKINTINGGTMVPGFDTAPGSCNASVIGSTEGVTYGQRLDRQTNPSVVYWRKTICRTVPLFIQREIQEGQLNAMEYLLLNNTYDRMANLSADCYKGFGAKPLPDGLSDLSKCFYDFPLAASNPHFYGREDRFTAKIEGLKPNYDKHVSYIVLEPMMGVPIRQCAKSQSNLVLPNMQGLTADLARFSDMVLPLFWMEYDLAELTTEITVLLVIIRMLPTIQLCATIGLFCAGICCTALAAVRFARASRFLAGENRRRCSTGDAADDCCAVVGQRKLSLAIVKANETVRHIVLDSQLEETGSISKHRV